MARKVLYRIADIFYKRWSSRAMSDEPVTKEQLMILFEAARWAPSAYNEQPWRFIYTRKGSKLWKELISLMSPFNQSWAKNADVLVMLISKKDFEGTGKPSHLNSLDAGAAWMSIALQGSLSGLVIHAIGEFDYDRARVVLNIPSKFKVEMMIAIGKPGNKALLPQELQVLEVPNGRKPLNEIIFEEQFKPEKV